MRAILGCFTSCLTARHTSRLSLQLPGWWLFFVVWFLLFWGGFVGFVSRGALADFYLT